MKKRGEKSSEGTGNFCGTKELLTKSVDRKIKKSKISWIDGSPKNIRIVIESNLEDVKHQISSWFHRNTFVV